MRKSRAGKPTGSSTAGDTRRRWTSAEKAQIVRRHRREGVAVADLAEATGAAPSLIHGWIKLALERLDLTVEDRRMQAVDAHHARRVARTDARIRQLEGVVAELATEVLTLRKSDGAS